MKNFDLGHPVEAIQVQNENKTLEENLSELIKTAFLDGKTNGKNTMFSRNFFMFFFK